MELNVKELKRIAKSNNTAEIVATTLALRQRLGRNTNIPRLGTQLIADGERIDEKEYNTFWKQLEAAGVGRIIYGRGHRATVFQWFYNLKDVAQSAVDGTTKDIQKIEPKAVSKRKRGYTKTKHAHPIKTVLVKAPQNLIKVEEPQESPKVLQTVTDKPSMNVITATRIILKLSDDSIFDTVLSNNLKREDFDNIIKTLKELAP